MRLCKQCAIGGGGGGHEQTRSWEVDDVAALLLLPLKLIWAEVQDSVCEPGAARTRGPTKRGEQDETLRVTDAWVEITTHP